MNRRLLLIGLAGLLCLAALSAVFLQHAQLTALRAEQRRLVAASAAPPGDLVPGPTAEITAATVSAPFPAVSPELLRLRGEVTRLTRQRDELASVGVENQRLRSQAANGATGTPLPAGYLRKSEARMVGYNTPDDTLQSLLWAMHNRDFTNLLQALTPEAVQQIQTQAARSGRGLESFFQGTEIIPGFSIVSREPQPDGSISLKAEIAPGLPFGPVKLRQINGEWKMDEFWGR